MGVSPKSKRITWAPDVNLCQVRLFSSAKPPSEVGIRTQVRLQVKAPSAVQSDESLPPGFEDFKPANLKFPQIPLIKWRCPPRYAVKSELQVVSGEESKEIEFQNHRERRVLEAIYPRPSAIPPNPRLPVNAEESIVHDQNIPVIPLTPIEDAIAGDASSLPQAKNTSQMIPQPDQNGVDSPNIAQIPPQPDIVAAAMASVVSNSSNDDIMNLIDHDLLLRILNNPKMLQQLLTQKISSSETIPNMKLQPKNYTDSTNIGINGEASLSAQCTKPQHNAAPVTAAAPPQLRTGFISTSCPAVAGISKAQSPCIVKDMNYYKSLIQQHGGVGVGVGVGGGGGVPLQSCGQSNRMMGASQEYRKSMKSSIMKPCIYFNSPRGCKNGVNCAYQHDMFSSRKRVGCVTEVVAAKRVKLGR